MKRVFIVHGWDDNPRNGWFPWLKREMESSTVEVHVPEMPDPSRPNIDTWIPFLSRQVGQPDAKTFFVGHSIGCQTILRYLELLPASVKVGGVILVAGWVTLKPEAIEEDDAASVADPWLHRPLNWPKIRLHADTFTAIMSDDDQFVPIEDAKVFQRELGARLIIEHQKRHLGGADGITILPSVRNALSGMLVV